MAASTSFNRKTAFYLAKLAERVQDYDEVVKQMKDVATKVEELTTDEMKLLQTGCGKYITRRRDSWATVSTIGRKAELEGDDKYITQINDYKQKLETEITQFCSEVISMITEKLIPSTTSPASYVFCTTMKGDYYRYLAEIKTVIDRQGDADNALETYNIAMLAASSLLPRAHPFRLGLDLNLAVFYHSILGNTARASQIADKTFDEAVHGLRHLSDKDRKESNHWLHCLNENMTLWNEQVERVSFTIDLEPAMASPVMPVHSETE